VDLDGIAAVAEHPEHLVVLSQHLGVEDLDAELVGLGEPAQQRGAQPPLPCSASAISKAVRYERRADILLGFLSLACALICLKSLHRPQGMNHAPSTRWGWRRGRAG
jgi:hypothetical protein